ncbi:PTS glucose transporter subunit IIA [Clostridiaceae bacterium OM08-6BH]|nr:PTS glucose transporter subunit IIA [Clostridiaceae bacterium OM08-6BH]
MKDQIFGVLQRVGRSFMLPIAVLPVAGLLLGIGSSFTNATMIDTYGLQAILGEGTILNMFLTVLSKAGSALFDNLPIIFAVGCAIGMAKKEKEVAALSAVIAYFTMNAAVNAMLVNSGQILDDGSIADFVLQGTITSSVGIQTLQMGVFGGIIVGLGVAALHNRFYTIELPSALAFFSGSRFVPIISTVVYVLVGIGMFFVWPMVQNGIYALGGLVTGTGYLGTLIFGIIKRALIPFGLHHVFYLPFWQTGVGGSMEVAGKMIEGGQNIFFAQLADPSTVHFSADACRYFSGEFIFMIFGLPGAALAMYQTAKPEKKKQAGGLLLSAALACMATGITEPLEFSFLFVAPMLFAVQVILAGAAYMIAHILNIAVGLTFSGGLLDLFLFGILQGNAKTSWLRIIPVGIIYFLLYYGIFRFLILKFDLKTPGREDEDVETKLYTKADYNAAKESGVKGAEVSALITAGLGGKSNIEDVDCCATRLRCTIKEPAKVEEALLKQSGSRGVILKGKGIQVIYGPQVAVLKTNLEAFLQTAAADQVKSEDFTGISGKTNDENTNIEATVEKKEEKQISEKVIKSPMNGTVIPLSEVPDAVFSSEMLGKGFGVEPSEGKAYAPVDGEVTTVFDTKHALGLMSENGVELLIHIGMDTVKLNGRGFDVKVKAGDQVKAGDLLAEFDMDLIKSEGYPVTTAVVITNTDDCEAIGEVKTGAVTKDTDVLTVL